jgi:hypothetical protein
MFFMTRPLNHLAIIPDGNRRWAKAHNLPTLEGHRRGFDVAVKISRYIRKLGIATLTLWAFSTENWDRSKEEIDYLMKLYHILIDKYAKDAIKDNVKVTHLGRKDRIPESLLKKITEIEEKTKKKIELNQLPIPVTVIKIKDKFIVDPSIGEENAIDARLTITTVENGDIVAFQKGEEGTLTEADIEKMIELGIKKGKELRKLLK